MATLTLNDVAVTSVWQNITATQPTAANADVILQVVNTSDRVNVVFGGASMPVGKSGFQLYRGDSVQGNAAQIWVRSEDQSATLSVNKI